MQALWMIVAAFFFSCMSVGVKMGADTFNAGSLVFYRGLVGMLLLAMLARMQKIPLKTPVWRMHATRGFSGGLSLLCNFYAITALHLATAVTLTYTSPLFVTLLLMVWFREKLRRPVLLAVICGFMGVVLLLQPSATADQLPGAISGLVSGLLASVAYMSVRELGKAGEPDIRTVFWFSTVCTLIGLPWAVADGLPEAGWHSFSVIFLVGGCAAAAQLALTRAYRLGKTIVAANLSYCNVVFSSLFGWWLWQEHLSWLSWLGVIVIIGSSIAISWFSYRVTVAERNQG